MTISVLVLLICTNIITLRSNREMQNIINHERKLAWAYEEMLHDYWQYKDIEEFDDGTSTQGNFFLDCIMETDAFFVADSLKHGDWEDFFYEWH